MPTDDPQSSQPLNSAAAASSFRLVSFCFFLSGMAGLIYQMVWMRYLSTVFGTSELAIIAVLVAYMGGLAAGAWLASKYLHRLTRPIIAYALLEGAIALSAIAVPLLLKLSGHLRTAVLGGQHHLPSDGGALEAISHLGLACLVLFIPTACMGATLPILAKGLIQQQTQIGTRIGWLYALNTFGAVAGTLLAAFLLIPLLGLWKASFVGVALNVTVAALGWSVARKAGSNSIPPPEPGDPKKSSAFTASSRIILPVMLVSGATSFVYEVLWARLLAHVLGGSFYSFATMLASFLTGIAVGGLIGAKLARNSRRSCFWLAGFEIATGLLTALILALVSSGNLGASGSSIFAQAGVCILVLSPATICLGATFPLAVRALSDRARDAGPASGKVYAWNTVGAIAGAITAGLLIIPNLGYAPTFKWAIVTNLLLAVIILRTVKGVSPKIVATSAALCFAAVVLYHPKPPVDLLTRSPLDNSNDVHKKLKLIHVATGKSATVSVLERSGNFVIRSNGLQEAEIFPKGAEALAYTKIRWLPALPKVLKPDAESMLVVGYGGGALLEAVPSGIREIDVVEIEEEVIVANRLVASRRAIDPLKDERINIVINDARGALKLSRKTYDAIVSQPSHPWTAGASHLYTREFLELADDHLNSGGIFVQWLGSSFVDKTLLGSFLASATEIFPHVQLYLVSDNFIIVCSQHSLDDRLWSGRNLFTLSDYPKLSYLEDMLAVLQLDEEGCKTLAQGHPPITDDRNLMATHHLPGKDFEGALNKPENLISLLQPLHFLNGDPAQVRDSLIKADVDLPYLTRLLKSGSPALDQRKFFGEVLTKEDRMMSQLPGLLDKKPATVIEQLEIAENAGISANEILPLKALAYFTYATHLWNQKNQIPPPREFEDFLKQSAELREVVQHLDDEGKFLLEARYWALTSQLARVKAVDARLATFNDHRHVWFEAAYQCRIAALGKHSDKSQEELHNDAQKAVALLNQLLALPLERNLPLIQQRIALAHALHDEEFLHSVAWIIATKFKRSPPSSRPVFGSILAGIFSPYLMKMPNGETTINHPSLRKLYQELSEELGPGAIPLQKSR